MGAITHAKYEDYTCVKGSFEAHLSERAPAQTSSCSSGWKLNPRQKRMWVQACVMNVADFLRPLPSFLPSFYQFCVSLLLHNLSCLWKHQRWLSVRSSLVGKFVFTSGRLGIFCTSWKCHSTVRLYLM